MQSTPLIAFDQHAATTRQIHAPKPPAAAIAIFWIRLIDRSVDRRQVGEPADA